MLFKYENSYIKEVTLRRRSAYVTGEDFSVKKKWKWIKRKSVSMVVVVVLFFCCTVLSVMRLIPLDCCYCGSSPSTIYLSLATIFLSFSSSPCTVVYFTLTDKNYFYPLLPLFTLFHLHYCIHPYLMISKRFPNLRLRWKCF